MERGAEVGKMRTMKIKNFIAVLGLAAPLGTTWSQSLYMAGAESSRDASYLYVGRMASIGHDALQNGPVYRLWVDQTKYQYVSNGVVHKASMLGAEAGVGILFNDGTLGGSVFASLAARDTKISPDDLGNDGRGSNLTVKLQTDLNYRFSQRWSAGLGASYTVLNQGYWARLRLMWAQSERLSLGLELVRQGDANYALHQNGVFLSGPRLGPFDLGLKAGSRQVLGERSAPYIGIELGVMY